MKRILITQRIDKVGEFKEIRDNISQDFLNMIDQLNYIPILVPNNLNLIKNIVKSTNFEGIILTGGGNPKKNDVRQKVELFLIKHSIKFKKPLLGFCRGAQLINLYFGGSIKKVSNHVKKKHFLLSNNLKKKIKTNCFHNFGITYETISNKINILAKTKDNSIEFFKHHNYEIYGIMWHPERSQKINKTELGLIKKIFR